MGGEVVPSATKRSRSRWLRGVIAGLVVVLVVAAYALVSAPTGTAVRGLPGGPSPDTDALLSLPIETGAPLAPNTTARENLRLGTDRWVLPVTGKGAAEGYFDNVSVAPGEQIGLHVRASSPTIDVSVVRLGWYGSLGGRLVGQWRNVPVARQPEPTTDARTGLIVANWSTALAIRVPRDWVTGLYLAVLQPPNAGAAQYASFVVRETAPVAPILWVSPVTTHEAYNSWGGKSLYPDGSTGANTLSGSPGAVTVSFDRPFQEYRGAGRVLRWEYPFARWMEGQGYDVAYAADVDLARDPTIVAGRKLIVFVGHPEYWSRAMRTTLDAAIAAGTNVAFFSANEIYWRVRFDQTTGPFREVTCYRNALLDPLAATDPQNATTKWRDNPAPEPESSTIGEMYGHVVTIPADFVVSAPDHWIYAGTGVRAGDTFKNLVGPEYDRFWPNFAPAGLTILAASPVSADPSHQADVYGTPPPNDPPDPMHNATIYTAASGATVFAAGTIQWGWALDAWGDPDLHGVRTPLDDRVKLITKNILDRLGH